MPPSVMLSISFRIKVTVYSINILLQKGKIKFSLLDLLHSVQVLPMVTSLSFCTGIADGNFSVILYRYCRW